MMLLLIFNLILLALNSNAYYMSHRGIYSYQNLAV